MKTGPACLILMVLIVGAVRADETRLVESDDETAYTGCVTWGFEEHFFHPIPARGKEQWYVAAVPAGFVAMLDGIPSVHGVRTAFARVYATLGPEGRYGHMGLGTHEMTITTVLELRQFEEADGLCGTPPPWVPEPAANNPFESARGARPTRKSDALLLAAQRERWASE